MWKCRTTPLTHKVPSIIKIGLQYFFLWCLVEGQIFLKCNVSDAGIAHLGTQHSVPRLFLLRLSMPPTATHQKDNCYGRSAIWRVSKFVIPLIVNNTLKKWHVDRKHSHMQIQVIGGSYWKNPLSRWHKPWVSQSTSTGSWRQTDRLHPKVLIPLP